MGRIARLRQIISSHYTGDPFRDRVYLFFVSLLASLVPITVIGFIAAIYIGLRNLFT